MAASQKKALLVAPPNKPNELVVSRDFVIDAPLEVRAIPALLANLSHQLDTLEGTAARMIERLKDVLPAPVPGWVDARAASKQVPGSPLAGDLQLACERIGCIRDTFERVTAALQI
jgi:hypothetical protein